MIRLTANQGGAADSFRCRANNFMNWLGFHLPKWEIIVDLVLPVLQELAFQYSHTVGRYQSTNLASSRELRTTFEEVTHTVSDEEFET
jgi:hypothetical protein